MVESKPIIEQLTKLNKILDDLEKTEVNVEDEDKSLLMLCSLLKSFENFKERILYEKEGTTTLEEIQATLTTKKLTKFKGMKVDKSSEGLNITRERSDHRGKCKGGKSKS